MAGLVGVVLSFIASWNTRPLRKIRDSAIFITVFPLVLLLVAGFVGGWSWRAKLWIIEFELAFAIIAVLWLAVRRLPLAAEIGVAIAAASKTVTIANAAEAYLRFIASILVAEIFAGLVTLLPVHGNLSLSFLGLFLGIGWLVYWLWTGEEVEWWKRMVKTTLTLSLVAVVSGVLVPYLMPGATSEVVSRQSAPDAGMTVVVRGVHGLFSGTATPYQAYWAVAVVVILGAVAIKLLKGTGRAVAGLVVLLTLAALISWFNWGAGVAARVGAEVTVAAPVVRADRHDVQFTKPGEVISVNRLIPGCWQWSVDGPGVATTQMRFIDGAEEPILPYRGIGRRSLDALKGERGDELVYLWVRPDVCRKAES